MHKLGAKGQCACCERKCEAVALSMSTFRGATLAFLCETCLNEFGTLFKQFIKSKKKLE